jgi:hypothetical protein
MKLLKFYAAGVNGVVNKLRSLQWLLACCQWEGKSGIKHADREAITSNLHVFLSMGFDWPEEITIENKRTRWRASCKLKDKHTDSKQL